MGNVKGVGGDRSRKWILEFSMADVIDGRGLVETDREWN